jgi:hypothetical protein
VSDLSPCSGYLRLEIPLGVRKALYFPYINNIYQRVDGNGDIVHGTLIWCYKYVLSIAERSVHKVVVLRLWYSLSAKVPKSGSQWGVVFFFPRVWLQLNVKALRR